MKRDNYECLKFALGSLQSTLKQYNPTIKDGYDDDEEGTSYWQELLTSSGILADTLENVLKDEENNLSEERSSFIPF